MPFVHEGTWFAVFDLTDNTGDGRNDNYVYREVSLQLSSTLFVYVLQSDRTHTRTLYDWSNNYSKFVILKNDD